MSSNAKNTKVAGLRYLRVETGPWPADSDLPRWLKLFRWVLPAANPDFEPYFSQVAYWWLEVTEAGEPLREIGFSKDGEAIVLAPVADNYGVLIDASDDWNDVEDESVEAARSFEREWLALWPKFSSQDQCRSRRRKPKRKPAPPAKQMKSYEDYARRTFRDFLAHGILPDQIEWDVLQYDIENKQLDQAMHYLAHVVTDRDVRKKDPELDQVMRQELRDLIQDLGAFLSEDTWHSFIRLWLQAMVDLQNSHLKMDDAFSMVRSAGSDVDQEIIQFACDCISEIDGYPEDFLATIEFLKGTPSRDEVSAFMNS